MFIVVLKLIGLSVVLLSIAFLIFAVKLFFKKDANINELGGTCGSQDKLKKIGVTCSTGGCTPEEKAACNKKKLEEISNLKPVE